jgi:hypothetical protein
VFPQIHMADHNQFYNQQPNLVSKLNRNRRRHLDVPLLHLHLPPRRDRQVACHALIRLKCNFTLNRAVLRRHLEANHYTRSRKLSRQTSNKDHPHPAGQDCSSITGLHHLNQTPSLIV